MYEQTFPHKRFKLTYQFLEKHISKSETILDLGVENPFTKILKDNNCEASFSMSKNRNEAIREEALSESWFKY